MSDFTEADRITDVRQFAGIELLFPSGRGYRSKTEGADGIVGAVRIVPVGKSSDGHLMHPISFIGEKEALSLEEGLRMNVLMPPRPVCALLLTRPERAQRRRVA